MSVILSMRAKFSACALIYAKMHRFTVQTIYFVQGEKA